MNITLDRNSYSFVLFTKTKRSAKNENTPYQSIARKEEFKDAALDNKHSLRWKADERFCLRKDIVKASMLAVQKR